MPWKTSAPFIRPTSSSAPTWGAGKGGKQALSFQVQIHKGWGLRQQQQQQQKGVAEGGAVCLPGGTEHAGQQARPSGRASSPASGAGSAGSGRGRRPLGTTKLGGAANVAKTARERGSHQV